MAPAPKLYMDAVITPNRSLSKRGLMVLLGIMGFYNVLVAAFLLAIHAFPVPVFLGLDFAGVALAFHISNKRARRAERVTVSAERVEVEQNRAGKPLTVWSSPTAFTQVAVRTAGEHDARVELRLSGKAVAVGMALSPGERTAFARSLEQAILAARGERHGPALA